jgi:DNA-binding response OmpR family regulator
VLRQSGYDVSTAENGDTGLAESRATNPDLILLDFMMPGMNGYQFVKQLDVEGNTTTPVVLMVTRADQVPEGALKSLGVVDTITKPFSPEAIVALVGYCLERTGTQPRAETTRVTKLSEPVRPEDAATTPGFVPPERGRSGEGAASTENERDAADAALLQISRSLTDALKARGLPDAEAVSTSVCADVRASLSSRTLAAALKVERPSLAGDLSAVALPEVLQLLKFQGQTGVLDVAIELGGTSTTTRFEIATREGMIVGVRGASLRADLLLGNYFVGAGILSRAQLDAVLKKPSTAPIGQRLVEAGLVTTEQLRRCVHAQVQDLMTELLRARRGTFGLRSGEQALPGTQLQPGFSVDMILFESLRRIDEWSVIEQHVPSFDARFVRASDDVSDLSPDEIEVLSVFPAATTGASVDNARLRALTVHDVLRISSLRAFDCCKVLYRLCVLRRVRRVDDGAGGQLIDDDRDMTSPKLSITRSSSASGSVQGEPPIAGPDAPPSGEPVAPVDVGLDVGFDVGLDKESA